MTGIFICYCWPFLSVTIICMVSRFLQPSVFSYCYYAVNSSQEWAASGQNVPPVWCN